MPDTFVKYTPAVEQADPDFDKNLQTVITAMKKYIQDSVESEGLNRAVRDAHAKGYGLARAEVEILGGLAPEYTQGAYALPGRHEAMIRFSNGSAHAGADALLGNPVGMGLKLFGIEGQTLLEDEPDSHTFDYAMINAPIFFCNTVEHYLFIQQLFLHAGAYFRRGKQGQHQFFHDWVTGMGTLAPEDWAWDELGAMLSVARVQPVNLLLSTYWTMGAVRHGEYVAKVRLAQQDISGEDNLEQMDATSMTPWRCREEHRPLGNIQRARKEVYRQSSLLRHELNHQIRREPKSLAEVFSNA